MNREHDKLISAWLDGSMQPDDFKRFQELLRTSAELRKRLRHEVNLDMVLREHASVDSGLRAWNEGGSSSVVVVEKGWRNPRRWMAVAATLAVLGVGATALLLQPDGALHRVEEMTRGSAILTRTANARWEGSVQPRQGDTLRAGSLKLAEGVAQIEFFSGATLLVEEGSEIEIKSPWEVVCHTGKVRALVPPPAQGFKIQTPDMELVDLGTEFGVHVDPADNSAEVHVFNGEVEAYPKNMKLISLKGGQGLRKDGTSVSELSEVRPDKFVCLERMESLCNDCDSSRLEEWKQWKKSNKTDERLIAYYAFQRSCNWERSAGNDIKLKNSSLCTGGIVGARWTQGRWEGKDALEFKRPGDRVRLRLDGSYNALTFVCWVKVDGLDRKYNALLLTDGYEAGEPHWQILEDGRLMFSISHSDIAHDEDPDAESVFYSPVVFNRSNLGRWHQLAVTYDSENAEVVSYFDGKEISREKARVRPQRKLVVYGASEIGNWGLPAVGTEFPIRNFNGCMDEFLIYQTALSSTEIANLYEAGRQD